MILGSCISASIIRKRECIKIDKQHYFLPRFGYFIQDTIIVDAFMAVTFTHSNISTAQKTIFHPVPTYFLKVKIVDMVKARVDDIPLISNNYPLLPDAQIDQ